MRQWLQPRSASPAGALPDPKARDALWPPRCGNEHEWNRMPVNHGEFAKRVTLSTSEAGLGVWYNVSADLHRKCIVHASIALPFGRKDLVFNSSTGTGRHGCPFRMDVCRHQELTRAAQLKPFWNLKPLPPFWDEVTTFGPWQFEAFRAALT